ncbi:MAG: hypothetical protein ACJA1U_001388 [Bermanella sp.]|jgi:hypothetical protein
MKKKNHLIYCVFILILFSIPGYKEIISELLIARDKSKNVQSLGFEAILGTDFGMQLLQHAFILILLTISSIYILSSCTLKLSELISNKVYKKLITYTFPVFSILSIFLLNSKYFPNSSHYITTLGNIDLYSPTSLLLIACLITCILYPAYLIANKAWEYKIPSIILSGLFLLAMTSPEKSIENTNKAYKNVIIIGIDSLRLDLMKDQMPYLSSWLERSSVFKNSFTPFARTFPAWSTILSGSFPPNHGARFNLIDETLLNKETKYLPEILADKNFKTVFATDERRFSYIGEEHGFEYIIGPRTGLSDFVLGQYSDNVILNLFTLLPFSGTFLPIIANNRAAAHLYRPDLFSRRLNRELNSIISEDQPLFLASHFCLAHWPFYYAEKNKTNDKKTNYLHGLRDIDKQIESLMNNLGEKRVLDNAIIIFISDHGESWQETITFNTKKSKIDFHTNGHGSNIINNNEHKVLISMNGLEIPNSNLDKTTTLADITPTILDQLKLYTRIRYDGKPLTKNIQENRVFPVESGFTVKAILNEIDIEKALSQAINRYTVNKSGELRIKVNETPFLLNGKEFGVRNKTKQLSSLLIKNKRELALIDYENMTLSTEKKAIKQETLLTSHYCKWFSDLNSETSVCPTN